MCLYLADLTGRSSNFLIEDLLSLVDFDNVGKAKIHDRISQGINPRHPAGQLFIS